MELLHEKIVSNRLFNTTRIDVYRNFSLEINELAHVTLSMKNGKRKKEKNGINNTRERERERERGRGERVQLAGYPRIKKSIR